MVTLENLKPTKRDTVVAVGSVFAYKMFVEKWIRETKSRLEAYFERREERNDKRDEEREKRMMQYNLEAQKQMLKELVPHLYQAKYETGKQSEANE